MHIHTVEEDYEYRMKNIMKKFIKDYELESIDDPEMLQDTLWYDYAERFAHAVLQDMNDFSGNELFEIGEWWYMDIKEVMRKAVRALLSSGSYDDLNEEQNAVVVEFETELYKAKVDELRKSMPPEEIKETIHDWWQDYEIADGTEDNLLAYV